MRALNLICFFSAFLCMIFFAPLANAAFNSSTEFRVYQSPMPAWVKARSYTATGTTESSESMLLIDHQVNITDGIKRYRRMVTQVNSQAGLSAVSEIKIEFAPTYERLDVHQIRIFRAGKLLDALDISAIRLIQRETSLETDKMYDGVVTAVAILSDVRVGDIIDYSYTVSGSNPVFGDRYFDTFYLGWIKQINDLYVRLITPKDRELTMRLYNADTKAIQTTTHDLREYELHLSSTRPIFYENDIPLRFSPFPYVAFSEYADWSAVERWAKELYSVQYEAMDELSHVLAKLRTLDSREEQVKQALRIVQDDIRYFGVEMDVNSHTPSAPGETYKRRYGDCKDKTVLLVYLLRSLNIDAFPALVSTKLRGEIEDVLPSPGAFNHVIAVVELKGTRHWLDGTRLYQRGNLTSLGQSDFERALIIDDRYNDLSTISINPNYKHGVVVNETYKVTSRTQPIELSVSTAFYGEDAERIRYIIASNDRETLAETFKNIYSEQFPSIQATSDIEVLDNGDENTVTVEEHYRIPTYFHGTNRTLAADITSSAIRQYIALPKVTNRKMPLAVRFPTKIREVKTVDYPDTMSFSPPQNVAVSSPYHNFSVENSVSGNRQQTIFNYETTSDHVPATDVKQHLNELRTIYASTALSSVVSIQEKGNSQPSSADLNRLLGRLDQISNTNN